MRPASRSSSCAAIQNSSAIIGGSNASCSATPFQRGCATPMLSAGGCDFRKATLDCEKPAILWTTTALPSVLPFVPTPPSLKSPHIPILKFDRRWIGDQDGPEQLLISNGTPIRTHAIDELDGKDICAVLPLDALFDVRLTAARRYWLALNGRDPGDNPAALSPTQRDHLIDALHALDARRESATYREIATTLFGASRLPERGWKTHDLRDRTIRLCRLGFELMQGGYRQLLLHPFRHRLF